MSAPEHHLFVCQNERPEGNPRGCCKHKGSEALLKAFKEEITTRGVRSQIEFDGSTCLDTCALGPIVVVYPEGTWYGQVQSADVPEIITAIANGTVVERLLVPPEAIRKS